jgi:hypothetical protein
MLQGKQIAAGVISVAFSIYLARGGFDWLPDWVPLAVMLASGLYLLAVDPQVRAIFATSFRTETGRIIHPGTNKPAQLPRLRIRKAVITIICVLVVTSVIGGIAWKYRSEALAVVGRGLFVISGAYHDPFGGPEQYVASAACVIENKTRYPTGLNKWRTSLRFKDGHSVEGMGFSATDKDVPAPLIDSHGRQLTMRAVDYLPIKAMQPIPPGGEISGWLASVFNGYTRSDVRGKGAILDVEFSEIATGKKHLITYSLDNIGSNLPPGTFLIRRLPGPPRP